MYICNTHAWAEYHVNVIYSLGVGTHTHIPMLQIKAISKNQVCAGFWLAHAWFKIAAACVILCNDTTKIIPCVQLTQTYFNI